MPTCRPLKSGTSGEPEVYNRLVEPGLVVNKSSRSLITNDLRRCSRNEIVSFIITDVVSRVGSTIGPIAIGSAHRGRPRNGIAKRECREFSNRAGQRRAPGRRFGNPYTTRAPRRNPPQEVFFRTRGGR